jgi:hypothetical protein
MFKKHAKRHSTLIERRRSIEDISQVRPDGNSRVRLTEAELARIWGELSAVRSTTDTPEPLRALELVRLMELQNEMSVEAERQTEHYLADFVKSLQLEDIGGKPVILGGIHCQIVRQGRAFRRSTTLGTF